MRQALDLAKEGHGQVLAVVGEPGAGKSRLIHEFTNSPLTQSWRILKPGRCPTVRPPAIYLSPKFSEIISRSTLSISQGRFAKRRSANSGVSMNCCSRCCLRCLLCWTCRLTIRNQGLRPSSQRRQHAFRRQAPVVPRERDSTVAVGSRGPAFDRCGDTGIDRRTRAKACRPLASFSSSVTGRSTSTGGRVSHITARFGLTRSHRPTLAKCSTRSSARMANLNRSSADLSRRPSAIPCFLRRVREGSSRPAPWSASREPTVSPSRSRTFSYR